jgi:hypothetical protein
LQIESAIQASSILTAIAGATAKIAKPGASTVDVISSIAVIISSLASGYALVKSYQDAAPKFFKGTDKVGGRYDYTNGTDRIMQGGKSKDDVPAWLHNGESVIQADMAEKYRPLIKAIRADNFIGIQKYISPGTYMPKQNITINNAITPAHIDALIQAVQSTKMDVKLDQNGFVASLTNIIDSRNKRASL